MLSFVARELLCFFRLLMTFEFLMFLFYFLLMFSSFLIRLLMCFFLVRLLMPFEFLMLLMGSQKFLDFFLIKATHNFRDSHDFCFCCS